ncbi:hypothetical protein TELCIR_16249, partial [Teladorsagia circumcincta]
PKGRVSDLDQLYPQTLLLFEDVKFNDFVIGLTTDKLPREAPVIPPTLDLHVYPPFAEFIEFGGATKHVLTNAGSSRMVFKVKCSNNSLFKSQRNWMRHVPLNELQELAVVKII